jgi:hypothetical protein
VRNSGFTVYSLKRVKKTGILYFLSLAVLLSPTVSWSQNNIEDTGPALTASIDPASAKIGDTVVVHLNYTLPKSARLPDEPEIKGIEGLTILKKSIEPGRISVTLLVDRLDPWKSEPIRLVYLDKEGKEAVLNADPVSLAVSSNLGDKPEEAQLRPIQDIIPTKAGWLKFLPWAAAFIFILLVLGCFLLYYKNRRSRKGSTEFVDPPHIRVRKEIERLEAQGLFEKGHIKEFYFLFSEILRRYLESIRHFPAAEFTTEEIANCLGNEQDRKLLPLLRQADLVKFADTIPTKAGKEEDLNTAKVYIHETSPVNGDEKVPTLNPEVVS